MQNEEDKALVNFIFEIGTIRRLHRMHQQFFGIDPTDSIATHSFRVAFIAYIIAKLEGLDPFRAMAMGLIHDLSEARSNDHNWLQKRYVVIGEVRIRKEQLASLPFRDLFDLAEEYEAEKKNGSGEARAAKDADAIDQILLLREYEWNGNKEAAVWLYGSPEDPRDENDGKKHRRLADLHFPSSKRLAEVAYTLSPNAWWREAGLYSNPSRE